MSRLKSKGIYLEPAMFDQINALAAAMNVSASSIIREALERTLPEIEKAQSLVRPEEKPQRKTA